VWVKGGEVPRHLDSKATTEAIECLPLSLGPGGEGCVTASLRLDGLGRSLAFYRRHPGGSYELARLLVITDLSNASFKNISVLPSRSGADHIAVEVGYICGSGCGAGCLFILRFDGEAVACEFGYPLSLAITEPGESCSLEGCYAFEDDVKPVLSMSFTRERQLVSGSNEVHEKVRWGERFVWSERSRTFESTRSGARGMGEPAAGPIKPLRLGEEGSLETFLAHLAESLDPLALCRLLGGVEPQIK